MPTVHHSPEPLPGYDKNLQLVTDEGNAAGAASELDLIAPTSHRTRSDLELLEPSPDHCLPELLYPHKVDLYASRVLLDVYLGPLLLVRSLVRQDFLWIQVQHLALLLLPLTDSENGITLEILPAQHTLVYLS